VKHLCNVNKFCCNITFGKIILKWALKKYVDWIDLAEDGGQMVVVINTQVQLTRGNS